jgi:ribosomal protein L11 methyltransferase
MNYIEYTITIKPFSSEVSEIVVACLAEIGFESFVDTDSGLLAYVPENNHRPEEIKSVLKNVSVNSSLSYTMQSIEQQNWNAIWESNFEPIFIDGKIAVVAPFHEVREAYQYKILIEPKMSFGTGHHETTSLVMSQMLEMDWESKNILDMGSGTGILAILAKMLGANSITAIDNDEWAFTNALENFEKNKISCANVILGDAGSIPGFVFDIIIANINRNILLRDINVYCKHLKPGGLLLLSGFYSDDNGLIVEECSKNGLTLQKVNEKNRWVSTLFIKGL